MRKMIRWIQEGVRTQATRPNTVNRREDEVRPVSLCFEVSLIHISQPEVRR